MEKTYSRTRLRALEFQWRPSPRTDGWQPTTREEAGKCFYEIKIDLSPLAVGPGKGKGNGICQCQSVFVFCFRVVSKELDNVSDFRGPIRLSGIWHLDKTVRRVRSHQASRWPSTRDKAIDKAQPNLYCSIRLQISGSLIVLFRQYNSSLISLRIQIIRY